MKIINYDGYLTEDKLGDVLGYIYDSESGFEVVPQWKIEKYRVDFMVMKNGEPFRGFEFDGYRHFTNYKCQRRDCAKEFALEMREIPLTRIPYFVQLKGKVLSSYFPGIEVVSDVMYAHGFRDPKALFPCDFNTEGFSRFINHLERLPSTVCTEIVISSEYDNFYFPDWPVIPDNILIGLLLPNSDTIYDKYFQESIMKLQIYRVDEVDPAKILEIFKDPLVEDADITSRSINLHSCVGSPSDPHFSLEIKLKNIDKFLGKYFEGQTFDGSSPSPHHIALIHLDYP